MRRLAWLDDEVPTRTLVRYLGGQYAYCVKKRKEYARAGYQAAADEMSAEAVVVLDILHDLRTGALLSMGRKRR